MLYSTGTLIGTSHAVEVTQATAGIPGSPGANDNAGNTMATGDDNGDGPADLAIYSPGDHLVTVVAGATAGLSFSTAVSFTQSSPGVAGTSLSSDLWGDGLRFESFKAGVAQASDGSRWSGAREPGRITGTGDGR